MAAKKPKSNRKPKAGDTDYQIDRYYQMYYGSNSQDGPQQSKDEFAKSKAEKARLLKIKNRYNYIKNDRAAPTRTSHPFSTGQTRAKYTENVKSPGRAQPKGTAPAPQPRTGPSAGGSGGGVSRYNRLTGGGLNKPGR